jgi:hypothetical protein
MESLISNKSLLFGFIILLVINTIYRPRLPVLVKKMLNNAPFKIALITYLTYNSKYTIEFSLIVAVTILVILEMVREIEHFEITDGQTTEKTQADKSNEPDTPTATDSDSDASNKSTENKKSDKVIPPPVTIPPTTRDVTSTVPNVPAQNNSQVPNVPTTTPSAPKAPTTPTALQSNGMANSTTPSSPSAVTSKLGLSGDTKSNTPTTQNTPSAVVDTSDQTFVNKETTKDKKDTPSNGCVANIPKLSFSSKVHKDVIVEIFYNTSFVSPSGICKRGTPLEITLLLGNYKLSIPSETDEHYLMPPGLLTITKEEKGVNKEINMIIRQGYKVTITAKDGSKSFFGATSDEHGYYNKSEDIIKGLVDISEIDVTPI